MKFDTEKIAGYILPGACPAYGWGAGQPWMSEGGFFSDEVYPLEDVSFEVLFIQFTLAYNRMA